MQRNENAAWEEFLAFYAPLIRLRANDLHLTDAEFEELRQDLCVNLVTRQGLAKFDPARGRFRDYLRSIITNCAIDLLRRRTSPLPSEPLPAVTAEEEERSAQQEWQDFLLEKAQEAVRARCDALNFMAFELHVKQERPVPEVAAALGISEARVSQACSRIVRRLRKEVARLETELEK